MHWSFLLILHLYLDLNVCISSLFVLDLSLPVPHAFPRPWPDVTSKIRRLNVSEGRCGQHIGAQKGVHGNCVGIAFNRLVRRYALGSLALVNMVC